MQIARQLTEDGVSCASARLALTTAPPERLPVPPKRPQNPGGMQRASGGGPRRSFTEFCETRPTSESGSTTGTNRSSRMLIAAAKRRNRGRAKRPRRRCAARTTGFASPVPPSSAGSCSIRCRRSLCATAGRRDAQHTVSAEGPDPLHEVRTPRERAVDSYAVLLPLRSGGPAHVEAAVRCEVARYREAGSSRLGRPERSLPGCGIAAAGARIPHPEAGANVQGEDGRARGGAPRTRKAEGPRAECAAGAARQ